MNTNGIPKMALLQMGVDSRQVAHAIEHAYKLYQKGRPK